MKKIAYIIFFLVLSFGFVMSYFAGYYLGAQKIEGDSVVENSDIEENNPVLADDDDSVKSVDAGANTVLAENAIYTLESYNITTETTDKNTLELPEDLIGLTRDEVINYISEHIDSFAEAEESITNVQLVSFSSDSIVIRKSFETLGEEEYKYWLQNVDGIIVVYKADKTTVYFKTDINVSALPEEEQELLKTGKSIKNIHELYNYLESYSS